MDDLQNAPAILLGAGFLVGVLLAWLLHRRAVRRVAAAHAAEPSATAVWQEQLAAVEREATVLRRSIRQRDQRLTALEVTADGLRGQLAERPPAAHVTELEQHLADTEVRVIELTTEVRALTEQRDALLRTRNADEVRVASLRRQVERLEAARDGDLEPIVTEQAAGELEPTVATDVEEDAVEDVEPVAADDADIDDTVVVGDGVTDEVVPSAASVREVVVEEADDGLAPLVAATLFSLEVPDEAGDVEPPTIVVPDAEDVIDLRAHEGSSSTQDPDDLTRIEGIGPALASALEAAGYRSFDVVADAEDDELRTAIQDAGLRFAPSLATWSRQAALLARGDEDGFTRLVDDLVAGRAPA